jgi:hypothetical protein
MVITAAPANTLNFADPEMSLVRVTLQIVEHPLLAAIQAHLANVRSSPAKTNGKPAPSAALHSRSHRG